MPHAYHARLADEEYHTLTLLVGERTGICLGAAVRETVCCRVRQQMHAQGCRHFGDYLARLQDGTAEPLLADLCAPLQCRPPRFFSDSSAWCHA